MDTMITTGRVTYVVPFYWGYFIDISHVLDKGYRTVQRKLVDKLNVTTADESWFIEDDDDDNRVWQMKEMKVYGGTTKIGTSFISKRILPKKKFYFVSCELTISEIIFFYHEFGTATARIKVDFKANEPLAVQDYEDLTRSRQIVNGLLEFVNTFIRIDGQILTEELRELKIPVAIDAKYFKELTSRETMKVNFRKALWEHLIYEVHLDKDGPLTDEDLDPYTPLINSSQTDGATNTSLRDDIRLYPGFGTSLVLTNNETKDMDFNLIRTVEIAESYYAATSLLDDFMYDKFITFSVARLRTTKISKLQDDLDELKSLSNILEAFLFILKDSIINLNAHAKLIWNAYEDEWYYRPMIDTLEEKSITLNDKYRDLLNELNEKRNATLNRFVKIFTVFAVLGPILEAYSLVQETDIVDKILEIDPIFLISFAVIVILLITGTGAYIFSKLRQF